MGVLPPVERRAGDVGPEEEPVGLVLDVDADLLLDDLLLVAEILLGEVEHLHPVGLEPEDGSSAETGALTM